MGKLEFNPPNLYEDEVAFPDPASETETRRQLNEGCKQIQDYINDHVPTFRLEGNKLIINSRG